MGRRIGCADMSVHRTNSIASPLTFLRRLGRAMDSIVPVQCWMARTALGWGVRDLARAAEVSPDTVTRFERGDTLKEITVEVIQRTLERAGVVFIGASSGGPGARLERGRGAAARRMTGSGASAI
jgi:hypothetical protein